MRLALVALFAAPFSLIGCTYVHSSAMSSGTLGQNQKAIGIVHGEAEKDYIFLGLIQVGDDSLEEAAKTAINQSSAPAQGLINAFADKSCTFILPGIFWYCKTSIFGTAIQYSDIATARIPQEEGKPPKPQGGYVSTWCQKDEKLVQGRCIPITPGK